MCLSYDALCVEPAITMLKWRALLWVERERGMETWVWIPTQDCFSKQTWCHHSALYRLLTRCARSIERTRTWSCSLSQKSSARNYGKSETAVLIKHRWKAGASRAGRHSIVKSPRIIYTGAANEQLAVVFDPRNDCATSKCIIAALILSFFSLHLAASPLIINRHIPVEMQQAVKQSSARFQECDHTQQRWAATANRWQSLRACFSTVKHGWTLYSRLFFLAAQNAWE